LAKYCERYKGILVSESQKIFRARCKTWSCHYCARENKTAWRKAIRRAIAQDPALTSAPWVMMTFTMPPWVHKQDDKILLSAKVIKGAWNRFLTRLKKYYQDRENLFAKYEKRPAVKQKITYVRVLENHKSGVLHIHFLANIEVLPIELYVNPNDPQDIRLKWLKAPVNDDSDTQVIESYGFGYRHHILTLGDDPAFAVNYVTKYLTKDSDPAFAELLKETKIRRIQTSRNIKAPRSLNDESWIPRYALNKNDFEGGLVYDDLNLHKRVTSQDLDEYGIYPPFSESVDNI